MQNRMNTIEAQLETDFEAEEDISEEFNLIERGFRENPVFSKHEFPVLTFEVLSCRDSDTLPDNDVFEVVEGQINIVVHGAELQTVRQEAKRLVSLVRDFLKSSSWTYVRQTKTGNSEVITTKENASYRSFGVVNFSVETHLGNDAVK